MRTDYVSRPAAKAEDRESENAGTKTPVETGSKGSVFGSVGRPGER
jgi:hypothetical protein